MRGRTNCTKRFRITGVDDVQINRTYGIPNAVKDECYLVISLWDASVPADSAERLCYTYTTATGAAAFGQIYKSKVNGTIPCTTVPSGQPFTTAHIVIE